MTWFKDCALLCILFGFLFFLGLGDRPLSNPDEGRYSEIPREMLVTGDYITPHLNGIKYFEKPPLLYWVQTLSFKSIGLNEWGARAPTAIFALLGCLTTYLLARVLYTRKIGLHAACILGSSLLYFVMSHVLTIDMMLSFLFLACFSCFLTAVNLPSTSKTKIFLYYGFYFFAALAVLAKGLIGVLFPTSILFFWIILSDGWAYLKKMPIFSGIFLFFIIIIPWHLAVQIKNPEFFNFYILDQQFLRFFTLISERYQPFWFFMVILFFGFFPWNIYLLQSVKEFFLKIKTNKIQYKNELFLLLWASVIFLFFSVSKSKLIPYILPIFPPISIMIAKTYSHKKNKLPSLFILIFTVFCMAIALLLACEKYLKNTFLQKYFFILAGILILGTVCHFALLRLNKKFIFLNLLAWSCAFNLTLSAISTKLPIASTKPLLLELKKHLRPEDLVVSYHYYYQDMPFYLKRLITLVDTHGELDFGMQYQTHTQILSENEFWKNWETKSRVYVMMNDRNYKRLLEKHRFHFIMQHEDDVLLTNHHL